MKYLIAAAAMTCALSSFEARASVGNQASAPSVVDGVAASDRSVKTAMGPVSAPHKPGGKVDAPVAPSAQCDAPSDRCPSTHHRTKRKRHGHHG